MTAYPSQTRTTLGQLCAVLWDSQSWPDVIQPGIEPGTVGTPLALRCSALDRCDTREPKNKLYSQNTVIFTEKNYKPQTNSVKIQVAQLVIVIYIDITSFICVL
jgi:hypothetical protein